MIRGPKRVPLFPFAFCSLFLALFMAACGEKPGAKLTDKDYHLLAERLDSTLGRGDASFIKANAAIDELGEAMAKRLKLRLADVKNFQSGFRKQEEELFDTLAQRGKKGDFALLQYENKGGRPHALFHLFDNSSGINYYDFFFTEKDGRAVVYDIHVYVNGRSMGDAMAHIVSAGHKRIDSADVVERFRQSVAAQDPEQVIQAYNTLPRGYRELKSVLLPYMAMCTASDSEEFNAAADLFSKRYGDDPGYYLLLFDHAARVENMPQALVYIDRLDKLVHDPVLDFYRANIYSATDTGQIPVQLFRKAAEHSSGIARDYSWRSLLNLHIYYNRYDQALALCKELVGKKYYTKKELRERLLEGQTLFLFLPDVAAWLDN